MCLRDGLATTCADISRHMNYDSGAITRVVDQLEARGFVTRSRSLTDRRVVHLALTPEGRTVTKAMATPTIAFWNEMLDDFSNEETAQLVALLTRLLNRMEKTPVRAGGEGRRRMRRVLAVMLAGALASACVDTPVDDAEPGAAQKREPGPGRRVDTGHRRYLVDGVQRPAAQRACRAGAQGNPPLAAALARVRWAQSATLVRPRRDLSAGHAERQTKRTSISATTTSTRPPSGARTGGSARSKPIFPGRSTSSGKQEARSRRRGPARRPRHSTPPHRGSAALRHGDAGLCLAVARGHSDRRRATGGQAARGHPRADAGARARRPRHPGIAEGSLRPARAVARGPDAGARHPRYRHAPDRGADRARRRRL